MRKQLESTDGLRVFGECSKEPDTRVAFLPTGEGTYRVFLSIDRGETYHEGVGGGRGQYTGTEHLYFPTLGTDGTVTAQPLAESFSYAKDQIRCLPDATVTEYEALPPMVFCRWLGAIDERTLTTYLAGDDLMSGDWEFFELHGEPRDGVQGPKCGHGDVTMPYRSLVVVTEIAGKELVLDGSRTTTGMSSYGETRLTALTTDKYELTVGDDGTLSLVQTRRT